MKHRCKQVMEMGFEVFGLAKLFAQDWEGDVTIVMPATFAQVRMRFAGHAVSFCCDCSIC